MDYDFSNKVVLVTGASAGIGEAIALLFAKLGAKLSLAALDHFTRLISLELAPKGVRVNTVSPGVTVSEFVKRITGQSEEEYRAWLTSFSKKIPLGEPSMGDDIACMVVYIASEHSRLVTGTVVVDGGYRFNSSTHTPMMDK